MDGCFLSVFFYCCGINMCYFGKLVQKSVLEMIDKEEKVDGDCFKCFCEVCVCEMIVRVFKYIVVKYFKSLFLLLILVCFVYFYNCFFGFGFNFKFEVEIDEVYCVFFSDVDFVFEKVIFESFREEVQYEVVCCFRYILVENWYIEVRFVQLFCEIVLKFGFQFQVFKFYFIQVEVDVVVVVVVLVFVLVQING